MRNFEKPQYATDDNNLMSKRAAGSKMVEKSKIFGFNKRRPIYQQPHEEFDMSDGGAAAGGGHNASTVFYEIDDSRVSEGGGATGGCSKFNVSLLSNKDMDNFLNENHSNANVMMGKKTMNDYKYKFVGACGGGLVANSDSSNMMLCGDGADDDDVDDLKRTMQQQPNSLAANMSQISSPSAEHHHHHHSQHCNRNSLLKRKGICSSQEMLHLVDIMNDHISAEQVDVLAKSLVELGDVSLPPTESTTEPGDDLDHQVDLDHSALLLDRFPQHLDDRRLLENIDAAIYENQIIFQERIRKNQLTIQNLKLQDQLLSKCIEDMKSGCVAGISAAAAAASAATGGSEILSIRDYENMCFQNISRQQRGMKHWRNYFHDIDTSAHDTSTVQHSSYYVNTNTMSNSTTDLYINEDAQTDDGGASTVIIHDDDDDDDCDGMGGRGSGAGKGSCSADSVSSSALGIVTKKGVRWSSKLAAQAVPPPPLRAQQLRLRAEHFAQRADNEQNSCGRRAASETTAISDDLYINMSNHDDGVASAMSMDASTTTTRGSNSSVVVELGEDDEAERDGDEDGEEGAVALPQKNMLVETINKINVDSPVKSLLGGVQPKA